MQSFVPGHCGPLCNLGQRRSQCCAESPLEVESAVRRTVGAGMQEQLLNVPSWRGFNNPWMAEDEHDIEFSYINLMDNAERYTGYKVLYRCMRCLVISHVPWNLRIV